MTSRLCVALIFASIGWGMVVTVNAGESALNDRVKKFVVERESEFGQIPAERKKQLQKLTRYIKSRRASGQPARLMFICTHNSRRSHMSQLWASVAAVRYEIDQVESFSGGTERTAFNPRAVAAMQRAGFSIDKSDDEDNPRYLVKFADAAQPQVCFSKLYSQDPNPQHDFCAIMTCSNADESCPNVSGASLRIAIPYEDPKIADGTLEEVATYDERTKQIARELLYAFSLVP